MLKGKINLFMHNVEKWPNILLKFCGVSIARSKKCIWPFFSIMYERVKATKITSIHAVVTLNCWLWSDIYHTVHIPADIYLFKDNNRNTGIACKICSEFTVETPERRHLRTYFTHCSSVYIADFEQVNAGWDITTEIIWNNHR